MPPNPKRPAARDVPIREEHILKADDPRPQRVPQYPSAGTGARRPPRRAEEHIPTSVFDTEAADEEMQAQYGVPEAEFKPAFLYVERGPGMGQLLEVKQGTVVVGRASVSDLRLQHPSISRRHAQVKRKGEQFFVKDLGSQNGTFVNKQRIATEVEVKPGDTIAMGNALVRLRGPLEKGEKLAAAPVAASPKANKARIETAVVARHTGSHATQSNALKIAVFAGAVGFGLAAVLAVALVKTLSNKDSAAPAAVAKAAPSSPDERSRLIDEAIKRKMAEQAAEAKAAEAAPVEEAEVEADAPVVKVKATPQEPPKVVAAPVVRPAPVAVAKASKPKAASKAAAAVDDAFNDEGDEDEAAPAKSSPAAKRTQILASYEKGNAEASLAAAKSAGDKELIDKLGRFISAYDAANDAMMANNGTAAIMNFQKALQLDEQLSSGWGKYGAEIRRQLSNLYVLVGLKFVSDGQAEKGKQAFQAALKHDPNNQRAKAQLDKLGAAAKSPDDAFDDDDSDKPAAPRRAVKPKASASAIDDAFGD